MGLTSASETKAEVLRSTHDRLNTGLGELCRRYVARYMNTNHNQSTNKSEIRGIWFGADPSLTTHHCDDTRSSDTSDTPPSSFTNFSRRLVSDDANLTTLCSSGTKVTL